MIQQTLSRLLPLAPSRNAWVITNDDLRAAIVRQLPRVDPHHILAEPIGRNTAPAIGLAAFLLLRKNPQAVIGMFPSDHVISDNKRYLETLAQGRDLAAAGENIVVLGIQPTRADLIALYSQAQAFVFPSLLEGFGIPILEAMTCGAPVIASDRGAIPEVAGQAAWLVDAEDDLALSRCLEKLFTSPEQARLLRERGLERARQFSWTRTARRILDSYQLALSAHGSYLEAVG